LSVCRAGTVFYAASFIRVRGYAGIKGTFIKTRVSRGRLEREFPTSIFETGPWHRVIFHSMIVPITSFLRRF